MPGDGDGGADPGVTVGLFFHDAGEASPGRPGYLGTFLQADLLQHQLGEPNAGPLFGDGRRSLFRVRL
jgi:hypothetical protein